MSRRAQDARLVVVGDAAHLAWRVELRDGSPLRACSRCGLSASPEAAALHARTHGVEAVSLQVRRHSDIGTGGTPA